MDKKLFCSFSPQHLIEDLLENIKTKFKIKYNKIFILKNKNLSEYIFTYNVEGYNVLNNIPNTILVHRKKESNTLYTINALNSLIRSINNGMLDTSFIIPWQSYRNCILLTEGGNLKKIDTKIYKIVEF